MSVGLYTYLYESMLRWYARQGIAAAYLRYYAITTLTTMGLLNVMSIVGLCAHFKVTWATGLVAAGRNPMAFVLLVAGLLGAHLVYFGQRERVATVASKVGAPKWSHWVAPLYGVLSVCLFLFVSSLLQSERHKW